MQQLDFRFRIQEGLIEWPKSIDDIYSARLAVAAERPEEAMTHLVRHLRQQPSLQPSEIVKKGFYKLILKSQGESGQEGSASIISEPISKISAAEQLKYSPIKFDMDEVDLFLQVSRQVIDFGRKSLERLAKIDANLRDLRLKYVVSSGQTVEEDEESDVEIAIEDLYFTQEHQHEEFVYTEESSNLPLNVQTQFKTTAEKAREEQQLNLRGPIMGKKNRIFAQKQNNHNKMNMMNASPAKLGPEAKSSRQGKSIDNSQQGLRQSLGAMLHEEKSNALGQASYALSTQLTNQSAREKMDKHNLKMKIRMTKLYRKQIMKPLVNRILSMQLLIERELVPRLELESDWDHQFYKFSWDEFQRAKQEVRLTRQRDLEEGIENFGLLDPVPLISQDQQVDMLRNVSIKKILLMRMHADLSRYLCQFFTGFRRMDMVKSAIGQYQKAEALAWDLNQAHQVVLRLALSQATFQYEQMNSVEFAIKFTAAALIQAKNGLPAFTRDSKVSQKDIELTTSVLKILESNLKKWRSELTSHQSKSITDTNSMVTKSIRSP